MYKRLVVLSTLFFAIGLSSNISMSADEETNQDQERLRIQEQEQTRDRERLRDQDIYGWQLMTPEERDKHRANMRSLKTEAERETYRLEHHKKMQERAKERGITLPDMPSAKGCGMGSGGRGMGPHSGMGSGGGGGRGR